MGLFGASLSIHPALAAPFSEGERLVYEISWLGMNVGTGILEVKPDQVHENKEALRIISTARSNDLISVFFPVEDRIESVMDANHYFSYLIKVTQRHGSRRVYKEILFDQELHQAAMIYKGKTRLYSIPPQVQDSLSSLYFFRTLGDLTVGQSVFIDVHESKKNWRLEVQILGREKVTVPLGTFDTIKVKALVRYEGVLMDKGDVYLWITDDERRIPVLMKGRIVIGNVTAALASGRPSKD
jgi:hypothetical protein